MTGLQLGAHVHRLNFGQRIVQHATGHFQQRQFAALCTVKTFKTRRRGTEDDRRVVKFGELFGDDAGLIARRLLVLLVRAVLLLVDDNQADVLKRREQCRPCADND